MRGRVHLWPYIRARGGCSLIIGEVSCFCEWHSGENNQNLKWSVICEKESNNFWSGELKLYNRTAIYCMLKYRVKMAKLFQLGRIFSELQKSFRPKVLVKNKWKSFVIELKRLTAFFSKLIVFKLPEVIFKHFHWRIPEKISIMKDKRKYIHTYLSIMYV